MHFSESVRMSLRSIRSHKLRSTLTLLGIVIGIGAVITFVTLGASLQTTIIGDLTTTSSRSISVSVGGVGPPGSAASFPVFTERDIRVINDIPGVETVIPRGQVQTAALTYEGRTIAFSSVTATTPGQFRDQTFIAGRPFHMGAREVVLSQSAATLVPGNVSVGDTITIELADGESADATVVGIVEDEFAFAGVRTGPRVYVPTDPFYRTTVESPALGETQLVYPTLTVVAADAATIPVVETEVESYLTSRSDARVLAPPTTTFSVQTAEEQVQQIREIVGTLTEFVSGVAVISLLVGAIGIVNIMLVSVTERTKEIGIMKAVGARKRDILELFLVEAAILGTAGAILGTLVGFGGGYVATEALELTSTYPFEWVPVAIVVGVGVGVAAGLYPAWNAARTDPIDALRYE